MKKVGILYHPLVEATQVKAGEVEKFLTDRGVSAWMMSAWETEAAKAKMDGTDLVFTVGGDGTILRAAQAVIPGETPITGINLGKLGFMTELSVEDALGQIPALLDGKGWIDERATLEVEMGDGSAEQARVFYALNEVVVARGPVVRVVYVDASIDGQHIATYKADGVIVAAATGSTGYSLAAGGPVLYPQSKDMVLVPIMPHLSLDFPLVLPSTATVTLHLTTVHLATLSVDGHTNLPLSSGDIITVKQSAHTARFLRIHHQADFYGSLERRLKFFDNRKSKN